MIGTAGGAARMYTFECRTMNSIDHFHGRLTGFDTALAKAL